MAELRRRGSELIDLSARTSVAEPYYNFLIATLIRRGQPGQPGRFPGKAEREKKGEKKNCGKGFQRPPSDKKEVKREAVER